MSKAAVICAGLAFITIFYLSTFALAQAEPNETGGELVLDSIMITADKREMELFEIPSSATVVGSEAMEFFQIDNTEKLFQSVPNIFMTNTGPRGVGTNFGSIRGIASSMAGSPVLGIYIDDVYYPHLGMLLMDLERVEILRGPQGTLYGRNAEAGVINIITKNPDNYFAGRASVDYSSFNTKKLQAGFSGPIVPDKFLFGFAAAYESSDSYFHNEFNGKDDVNRYEDKAMRLKFMTPDTENTQVALIMDVNDFWSGGYADFAPLQHNRAWERIDSDYEGRTRNKQLGLSLRLKTKLPFGSLLSVTSFSQENLDTGNDVDFTPQNLVNLFITKDTDIFSEELRLLSDNPDSPLQWLLGVYAYSEKQKQYNTLDMAIAGLVIDLNNDIDSQAIAVFGDISYLFFDKLELSAGLRYDFIKKDIDYDMLFNGFSATKGKGNKTFAAWLPKFSAKYTFNDHVMTYATVSKGFREGGFNTVDDIGHPYESEYAVNYEIGAKTRWFDNRLTANLSFFRINWTNRQIEIMVPQIGGFHVDNAGRAESQGFELEIAARPVDSLTLEAGFGYTSIKYKEYKPEAGISYNGKKAIDSPQYTGRLAAAYRHPSGFQAGLAWLTFGKVYFDPANEVSQGSYSIVDANLGYVFDNFSITLYGHNIFNEQYFTRGVKDALDTAWYGRSGMPRAFGIKLAGYF